VTECLAIANQEVRRMLALGVPPSLDRDELVGEAHLAIAVARSKGTKAIRLAVRHALMDVIRRERMRVRYSGAMPSEVLSVGHVDDMAGEMVYDLAPRQMTAVRLVYYEGHTYSGAAKEMNCPETDIVNLIHAAKKNLREKLKESGA
jgi:DNA-directed RNA polymerase specialized sigma24 family protein